MKKIKNNIIMPLIMVGGMLLSFNSFAAKSDIEKAQEMFKSPEASDIIKAHNQRVANIDYEMDQVMNLINKYGSFSNRVDKIYRQENQRQEMKKVMDSELKKYWKIYENLKEARELLEEKPSFKYIQ